MDQKSPTDSGALVEIVLLLAPLFVDCFSLIVSKEEKSFVLFSTSISFANLAKKLSLSNKLNILSFFILKIHLW